MAILKNIKLANKSLITAYGKLQFSDNGTVEVSEELGRKLSTLNGYELIETKDEEEFMEEEYEEEVEEEVEESQEDDSDELAKMLDKMTVKQLEKYAKENGIDINGATKKADIISVILG